MALFIWRDPVAYNCLLKPYSECERYTIRDESMVGMEPIVILTYLGRRYRVLDEYYSHGVLIDPQNLGGVHDIATHKNLLVW